MINMIQNAKDQAASLAMAAYRAAVADGTLTVQSGLKRYTKQDVLNELFDSLDPTK